MTATEATKVIGDKKSEIAQALRDARDELRRKRNEIAPHTPNDPTWRDAEDYDADDWRELCAAYAEYAEELEGISKDAVLDATRAYTDFAVRAVGSTPANCALAWERAYHDHEAQPEAIEIVEEWEDGGERWDLSIEWAYDVGTGKRFREGMLFEVPGGWALTEVDL